MFSRPSVDYEQYWLVGAGVVNLITRFGPREASRFQAMVLEKASRNLLRQSPFSSLTDHQLDM